MRRAISSFTLLITLAACALVVAPAPAQATEVGGRRRLGFGFALGEPSSLVGKYFLDSINAVDFGLSFWDFGRRCGDVAGPNDCRGYGALGFFADYLWHDTLARGTAKLDWHFGPGGRLWVGDNYYGQSVALAARMPVGIDLTFDNPNFLEVFLEIGPALYIIPSARLRIEAMFGVRFYF